MLCTYGAGIPAQAEEAPTQCDPTMACCQTREIGGNPINVITGNKYQREVDLPALPGMLGLEIVRHYDSAYSRVGRGTSAGTSVMGILGRGWKLSYEIAAATACRSCWPTGRP